MPYDPDHKPHPAPPLSVSPNKCPHCGIVSYVLIAALISGYTCPICNKWVEGSPVNLGGGQVNSTEKKETAP